MIDYYEPNIDLTLLGAGFLAGYHVGAICLLTQIWPHKPYNRICGASCGGMLAALLVAGVRLEVALRAGTAILKRMHTFLRRPTIKLVSMRDLMEEAMDKILPLNAQQLCKGRLGISLTKLWSFENIFATEFDTRQEIIDAVSAGCFIPLWSGSLTSPKFKGDKCIDGAYSDNAPKFKLTDEQRLEGVRQVAVTPFASDEIEVSPPDRYGFTFKVFGTKYYNNWNNFIRANRAMIPMAPSSYTSFLLYGHRDMKEYVLKSNLVKCRDCYLLERQEASGHSAQLQDNCKKSRGACLLCLRLLEKVDSLKVTKELVEIMKV